MQLIFLSLIFLTFYIHKEYILLLLFSKSYKFLSSNYHYILFIRPMLFASSFQALSLIQNQKHPMESGWGMVLESYDPPSTLGGSGL